MQGTYIPRLGLYMATQRKIRMLMDFMVDYVPYMTTQELYMAI